MKKPNEAKNKVKKEISLVNLVKEFRHFYPKYNVGTAPLIISQGNPREEVIVMFDKETNILKIVADKKGQFIDIKSVKSMNKGSFVFNKEEVEIFYGSPK